MAVLHKVLIIVPAYNESEAIYGTLSHLQQIIHNQSDFQIDICVVNDGSQDETAEIVATFSDVTLLNLPYNLGIGGAMQTGYKYANDRGYDVAIQFDADGQHNAEDLATLIEPLVDQNIDMVVGSRFLTDTGYKGMLMRRIGIYYFSKLLYVFTGKMFTDPTSGFRAVNRKVIETFAKDYPKDYPEPEVLIYLHNQGFSIEERSVYMKARQGGVSSITPIRSVYYMLKVTLSIVMQRLIRE